MKIKFLIFLATLFFSTTASATCGANYCQGVGAAAVTFVYSHDNGNVYLGAPSDKANLNCTLQGGAHMVLQPDNGRFKEIYASILTALALGKTLKVRVIEGTSNCRVVYVIMYS